MDYETTKKTFPSMTLKRIRCSTIPQVHVVFSLFNTYTTSVWVWEIASKMDKNIRRCAVQYHSLGPCMNVSPNTLNSVTYWIMPPRWDIPKMLPKNKRFFGILGLCWRSYPHAVHRIHLCPQDSTELHEILQGNRQKLLLLDYESRFFFFILRGLSGIYKNLKKF